MTIITTNITGSRKNNILVYINCYIWRFTVFFRCILGAIWPIWLEVFKKKYSTESLFVISLFSSNLKATDATESLFYTVVSQEQWTEHIFGRAWALSGQWKCDDKSFMRFWTLCTWVHPFRSVILTFPYVNTWFCDLLIFAKYFWIVQSYPLDYFLFYANRIKYWEIVR